MTSDMMSSIQVFTPCKSETPERCDFVLMVDSLAYTKGSKTRYYMVELLEHIKQNHQWFGVAVFARGVGFTSRHLWGREYSTTYFEMMRRVPKTHLLLLETAGNDFLNGPGTISEYPGKLDVLVRQWSVMARQVSQVQMTVCGACSSVWGYKAPEGAVFDAHVERLRKVLHAEQIHTISGTNELVGVPIKDKCGHVAPAGYNQLFNAWMKWIQFGMRLKPGELPAPLQPDTAGMSSNMMDTMPPEMIVGMMASSMPNMKDGAQVGSASQSNGNRLDGNIVNENWMNEPCRNPGCRFLVHTNPAQCVGYCCQKCEGRAKGEEWARGGKPHYKHCEERLATPEEKDEGAKPHYTHHQEQIAKEEANEISQRGQKRKGTSLHGSESHSEFWSCPNTACDEDELPNEFLKCPSCNTLKPPRLPNVKITKSQASKFTRLLMPGASRAETLTTSQSEIPPNLTSAQSAVCSPPHPRLPLPKPPGVKTLNPQNYLSVPKLPPQNYLLVPNAQSSECPPSSQSQGVPPPRAPGGYRKLSN